MRGRNGRRRRSLILATHAVRAARARGIQFFRCLRCRRAAAIGFWFCVVVATAARRGFRRFVTTAATIALAVRHLPATPCFLATASIGAIATTAGRERRSGERKADYNEPDDGFRENRIVQVAEHAVPGLAHAGRRKTKTHFGWSSATKSGRREFLRKESVLYSGGHCSASWLPGQGRSLILFCADDP